MADQKAEKLAAARKLLKQFQQSKDVHTGIKQTSEACMGSTYNGNSDQKKHSNEVLSNGKDKNSGLDINQMNSECIPQKSASFFFSDTNNSSVGINFFDTLSGGKNKSDNSGGHLEPTLNTPSATVNTPPTVTKEEMPVFEEPVGPLKRKDSSGTDVESTLKIQPLSPDVVDLQYKYECSINELAIEKEKNIELLQKLELANRHIISLENEMGKVKHECNDNLNKEVSNLEDKLKIQQQTIEILVAEKSELLCQVENLQDDIKAKSGQCDDLSGRLKASRSNVTRLEKEVIELQEARNQHNNILKKLEQSAQENNAQSEHYRQQLEDSENEVKELKRRLDASFNESSAMRRELEEKESQLSMAQIRMQQLGSSEGLDIANNNEIEQLKEEIQSLKKNIFDLTNERDQNAHQYQQYINTLNSQLQDIASKYESLNVEKDDLKAREESLISHISELEKQMQKQMAGTLNTGEITEQNAKLQEEVENSHKIIENLTSEVETKTDELEQSKSMLQNKDEKITELENRLEQLQSNVPDAKLLQAAMESDKVAATRAIAQNNELKQNLSDMREAFIRLSNNKLELMEQLEKEQQCTAELREELSQHRRKSVSKRDHNTQIGHGMPVDGCSQTTYHDIEEPTSSNEAVSPEAMAMLEEKFRQTMNSLAELSEEKQKLEYLVLQLQGETETIGEYIALYQAQRSLLHQRACEKDQQVHAIAKEKEELRKKLAEITKLVPQLVHDSDINLGTECTELGLENVSPAETSSNTASKILSLVSEIGTSSLVQDKVTPETLNFHPCPLCSGKLITV